jgi:putative phosphoserine phosphatase/1-acylglycerol-3-phosphate O-acyltransferase
VRFLAKRELFDAPLVGWVARAVGGIPVDRGSGSGQPLRRAEAALRAGEVVIVLPQGTIPRGEAFFDPVLAGKTGTARLAAATGAPVVPVGLWGTEQVWPRAHRLPDIAAVLHPPTVHVGVGPPVRLELDDAKRDTDLLMTAIADLLPASARRGRRPTSDELDRTYPPGSRRPSEGDAPHR